MTDKESMIERNLPLVEHIVVKLTTGFPPHVDRQDLVSAGTVGLIEAVERYDESRGVPFAGYASSRIRGAVLDALREWDWTPRSTRDLSKQVTAAEQSFVSEENRAPSTSELAARVGLSEERINALRSRVAQGVLVALDAKPGAADTAYADPGGTPEDTLVRAELYSYLVGAVELLPERYREVIVGYYVDATPISEIADRFGVSQSRVSQIHGEALKMLRAGLDVQFSEDGQAHATKHARYAAGIADHESWRDRLAATRFAPERAAET